jgi:1D-myo-inositol 3-kinase
MSIILRSIQGVPDFLIIGHVTHDTQPDHSFLLGGTVSFASLTAYRLGLVAAIVTCADAEQLTELPALLPEIGLAGNSSETTTTFANQYQEGFRTLYLHARADELHVDDVPDAWRRAPIVLLGPVAQELTPELVKLFPRRPGAIIAAIPQGWLRSWDDNGRVWPTPWTASEEILPLLDVLVLSHDDLLPFANGNRNDADSILKRWSSKVPLLVATDGRHGTTLFQHGVTEQFPIYPTVEVDPTGAGDVFAAAFLVNLHRNGDPRAAVDFANCVASFSIEHEGMMGIPTMEMVMRRLRSSK